MIKDISQMKKAYTICFMATGGITVEAESERKARAYFRSEKGQKEAFAELVGNKIEVTEVYEEEDWDFED